MQQSAARVEAARADLQARVQQLQVSEFHLLLDRNTPLVASGYSLGRGSSITVAYACIIWAAN